MTETRKGFEHLCSFKEGWVAKFYRGDLILIHPEFQYVVVRPLSKIARGEVLPNDKDMYVAEMNEKDYSSTRTER